MNDPLHCITRLAAQLPRLDVDTARWLSNGLAQWLGGESLECALQLKASAAGERSARTRLRLALRDNLIRNAFNLLPAGNTSVRVRELQTAIKRLPVIRARRQSGHAPSSEIHRLLCESADIAPLPSSRTALIAIVENPVNTDYSVDCLKAMMNSQQ